MYKGRLLKAIQKLDPDDVKFCLAEELHLLETKAANGKNLLQLTASVYTVNGQDNTTSHQIRIIDYLSDQGLDIHYVDHSKPPCDQVSLVWFAVAGSRNPTVVKFLLDRGVRPDGLFAAGWCEDRVMIRLLSEYGIEVDQVVFDETPLLHCLKYGKHRSIEPLIEIGANVDYQDKKGNTALHHAMRLKVDYNVFKILVLAGADPDIENGEGRSARDIASRKHDTTWIRIIESHT